MWHAWDRGITNAVLVVKTGRKRQLRRASPRGIMQLEGS